MISNMTMPSRPAPPPPKPGANSNNSNNLMSRTQFNSRPLTQIKKCAPPPRPPPPKVVPPRQPPKQSVNILSNLFATKKNNKSNENVNIKKSQEIKIPPKIPAPPTSLLFMKDQNLQPRQTSDVQLISFDSPSSSPTLTQKSNTSDCVSVDSFSSDSNYSPHNGGMSSQAESGFEDDFSVADMKIQSFASQKPKINLLEDPFELDPFANPQQHVPSNIRNVKQVIPPKPLTVGNASFYGSTSSFASNSSTSLSTMANQQINDGLSNGKNLLPAPSPVTMPTIIKPVSSKGKISPVPTPPPATFLEPIKPHKNELEGVFEHGDIFDEDLSLPSLPMPSVPPPPLPVKYLENPEILEEYPEEEEQQSYGIALFDFESEHDEDLNFKANEKIYLIKQMNDEWFYGKNKRGCEGIFPINYIDVKKPLMNESSKVESRQTENSSKLVNKIKVLYNFNAEELGDLTLRENEEVTVLYEINAEWLYGVIDGKYGQFPSNFIEYVPANLPKMPSK